MNQAVPTGNLLFPDQHYQLNIHLKIEDIVFVFLNLRVCVMVFNATFNNISVYIVAAAFFFFGGGQPEYQEKTSDQPQVS